MTESQFTVLSSILLASLLGSPHCVAMCGGFATLSSAKGERQVFGRAMLYHLGRLITYLLAGLGASTLSLVISPVLIGGILILVGLALFFKRRLVPDYIHRGMTRLYRAVLGSISKSSAFFPLFIGLASTFLPCGWLYIYVGVAAASDWPLSTMFFFWLGTLPILTVWLSTSDWLLSHVGRYFPALKALLLIAAGIFSILQHQPNLIDSTAPVHCHHSNP